MFEFLEHQFEEQKLDELGPHEVLEFCKVLLKNPVYLEAVRVCLEHAQTSLSLEPISTGLDALIERNNALLSAKQILSIHNTVLDIQTQAREDIQ